MRIYALSDVHIDYEENQNWLLQLSESDYKDDILLLAGDVTDILSSLTEAFEALARRFYKVLYVPGNHDLWVLRSGDKNSFEKFDRIISLANDLKIQTQPLHLGPISIVPLFAWYDYSFASPSVELKKSWVDFKACKWPPELNEKDITGNFLSLNKPHLTVQNQTIITFSHFVPRIDVMPSFIPLSKQSLYPVLGTSLLEKQIRTLGSTLHVYGHSHVNMRVTLDNVAYINNAFGYPHETVITRKELLCVYEF